MNAHILGTDPTGMLLIPVIPTTTGKDYFSAMLLNIVHIAHNTAPKALMLTGHLEAY